MEFEHFVPHYIGQTTAAINLLYARCYSIVTVVQHLPECFQTLQGRHFAISAEKTVAENRKVFDHATRCSQQLLWHSPTKVCNDFQCLQQTHQSILFDLEVLNVEEAQNLILEAEDRTAKTSKRLDTVQMSLKAVQEYRDNRGLIGKLDHLLLRAEQFDL
jgi:hypothetical protein